MSKTDQDWTQAQWDAMQQSAGHQKSLDDATPDEWTKAAAIQRQVGGTHYKKYAIQPIEFIVANDINFCEGNAIKYICRHGSKGGVNDIDKAIHYLELLKELQYES